VPDSLVDESRRSLLRRFHGGPVPWGSSVASVLNAVNFLLSIAEYRLSLAVAEVASIVRLSYSEWPSV